MNTNYDSLLNYLTVFLDRTGQWFLTGDALARFVCSGTIDGCKVLEFGLIDVEPAHLEERLSVFGLNAEKIGDSCYTFEREGIITEIQLYFRSRKGQYSCDTRGLSFNIDYLRAPDDLIEEIRNKRPELTGKGMWRRQICDKSALSLQLPYCYGTILDIGYPDWHRKVPRRPYPTTGDLFYAGERKKNAYTLITKLLECGERAGIGGKVFSGFGTMLGYLMYGDLIAKDRDLDTCILSDGMTSEQHRLYGELAYNVDVQKPSRWEFSKRQDNDNYLWFSVGYKNPVAENGTKSCNWFFFSYMGYWFHSKGGRWVNPRKINQTKVPYQTTDEAIALGQPARTITGLIEVPFGDTKTMIPNNPGMCADWWYPGWGPRGDGASAHHVALIVGKWADQNTWRIA